MHSCIYEGQVSHHRYTPVKHHFQYSLFMVYLDLAELSQIVAKEGLISQRQFAAASFLESDHTSSACSLEESIHKLVEEHTGNRPKGPIRLLTQLRYIGYYFSPLNLYYCFDAADKEIDVVVAEVSNTPWGEKHCYVLWEGNRTTPDSGLCFRHKKAFHVSPFMDMCLEYQWRLGIPEKTLNVSLTNTHDAVPFFTANMSLMRKPLSRSRLIRFLIRYPFMSARIVAAIYYQALRLWMKKCPNYPHPNAQQVT